MNDDKGEEFDGELQAYVDGELDALERRAFERRMRDDATLADDVARLQELKQVVREAYAVAPAGMPLRERRPPRTRLAVAAALLVGLLVGYFATGLARDGAALTGLAARVGDGTMTRVLLHVGSNDPDVMREALTSARYILSDFADSRRRVRVHVVANGKGLDMFRRSVTTLADEIRELERTYSNIQFVTCQNTIDRFEREKHQRVDLLPEVLRVDSIVADIARKRVQGWLYIGV